MTASPYIDSDALVDSWRDPKAPPLSKHLKLEIANALWVGHRPGEDALLGATDPVPGCPCAACRTLAAGGTWPDAREAQVLVQELARVDPGKRYKVARWISEIWVTPPPEILLQMANHLSSAREVARRRYNRLPVEEARRASIVETAGRLGLELRRVGRSYRGPCPIHKGEHRNFAINPERGLFKCFVCDEAGDGIALWMAVRQVSFPEAVRELARA